MPRSTLGTAASAARTELTLANLTRASNRARQEIDCLTGVPLQINAEEPRITQPGLRPAPKALMREPFLPPVGRWERMREPRGEKQEGRKQGKQEETFRRVPTFYLFPAFLLSCLESLEPITCFPGALGMSQHDAKIGCSGPIPGEFARRAHT